VIPQIHRNSWDSVILNQEYVQSVRQPVLLDAEFWNCLVLSNRLSTKIGRESKHDRNSRAEFLQTSHELPPSIYQTVKIAG
jgi:hypothetical protein